MNLFQTGWINFTGNVTFQTLRFHIYIGLPNLQYMLYMFANSIPSWQTDLLLRGPYHPGPPVFLTWSGLYRFLSAFSLHLYSPRWSCILVFLLYFLTFSHPPHNLQIVPLSISHSFRMCFIMCALQLFLQSPGSGRSSFSLSKQHWSHLFIVCSFYFKPKFHTCQVPPKINEWKLTHTLWQAVPSQNLIPHIFPHFPSKEILSQKHCTTLLPQHCRIWFHQHR